MMSDFVLLDRRFTEIPKDQEDVKRLEELEYTALFSNREPGLDWNGLIKRKRVVVLGTAGSGKSAEFRNKAKSLSHEGHLAFYVDLVRLVSEGLEAILDQGEKTQFERWRKSTEDGWLFLDSVDEARLQNAKNFETALKRLRRSFDTKDLTRLHLFLSSRINAWRGHRDNEVFTEQFLPGQTEDPNSFESKEPDPYRPFIIAIQPLDEARVERFAFARGVSGSEFISAIRRGHLDTFARRPIDVEMLISFWSKNGRLGSLTEIIRVSIENSLKESDERNPDDLLSPEKARAGAEQLSGAVLLCKRRYISLPGFHEDNPSAISPRDVLPESWTDREIHALLSRGIFDVPLYGQIQFHHRDVEEYLTACWLRRLVDHNLPIHRLKQLLFGTKEGQLILRPALAVATAWLGCGQDRLAEHVRSWIEKAEPELYLRAGDPASLPIEYRQRLINRLVDNYQHWRYTGIETDSAALQRLASDDLAPLLKEKISDTAIADDLRIDFIRMAYHADLKPTAEAALRILLNSNESPRIKTFAAHLLAQLQDKEALNALASNLLKLAAVDEGVVGAIIIALFPNYISGEQVVWLVRLLPSVDRYSTDLPLKLEAHVKESMSPSQAILLLRALNDLLASEEKVKNYRTGRESFKYAGLASVLPVAIATALTAKRLNEDAVRVCAGSVSLLSKFRRNGYILESRNIDISGHLAAHRNLRIEIFRHAIDDVLSGNKERLAFTLHFSMERMLPLSAKDIGWITRELHGRHQLIQEQILDVISPLWASEGFPTKTRKSVFSVAAAAGVSVSRIRQRMPNRGRRLLHNVRAIMLRTVASSFWWDRRWASISEQFQVLRFRYHLLWNIKRIRNGSAPHLIFYIIRDAKDNDNSDGLALVDWSAAEKLYGETIVRAAKRGSERFWPTFIPLLWHEREPSERGAIYGDLYIGLAGIQLSLANKHLKFRSTSDNEAELLCRYALSELNGTAKWLDELYVYRPQPVLKVILNTIVREWAESEDGSVVHQILAKFAYEDSFLAKDIAIKVASYLEAGDPPQGGILDLALTLLSHFSEFSPLITTIAPQRITLYKESDRAYSIWLEAWLRTDASSCINYLESTLKDKDTGRKVLINLAQSIRSPRRREEDSARPEFRAADLYRLAVLFYKFFPPNQDPVYTERVRNVTGLDEAIRLRSSFTQMLADIDGDEVISMLAALRNDPIVGTHRDWIGHLLKIRTRRSMDFQPWHESDVRRYAHRYEIPPQNMRDLFLLVIDRLAEIKHDVEDAEDSPNAEITKTSKEQDIRVWIARKLRERSRGLYSVPEEHEIASGKRQDIRITRDGLTGAVVVELKQLEGWTIAQLSERLQNQLVNSYMRDQRIRFGICIVTFSAYKDRNPYREDPDTGAMISLNNIVTKLQRQADDIAKEREDIDEIRAMSINFRALEKSN